MISFLILYDHLTCRVERFLVNEGRITNRQFDHFLASCLFHYKDAPTRYRSIFDMRVQEAGHKNKDPRVLDDIIDYDMDRFIFPVEILEPGVCVLRTDRRRSTTSKVDSIQLKLRICPPYGPQGGERYRL